MPNEIKTCFKIDIEIYEINKPPKYMTITENSTKEEWAEFIMYLKESDDIRFVTETEANKIRQKWLNNEFDYDERRIK